MKSCEGLTLPRLRYGLPPGGCLPLPPPPPCWALDVAAVALLLHAPEAARTAAPAAAKVPKATSVHSPAVVGEAVSAAYAWRSG